jgi:hypothetical protein
MLQDPAEEERLKMLTQSHQQQPIADTQSNKKFNFNLEIPAKILN